MSDGNFSIAPTVDFNKKLPSGYTVLAELRLKRIRLQDGIAAIEAARRDMSTFNAEGQRYAGFAATAAGVLMLTDIVSTGMQAMPGSIGTGSRFLFTRWEQAEERARKLLKHFGVQTTTKADLLKGVADQTSRQILEVEEAVREAREHLKKVGVKPPKELAVVLDLASKMAQDSALMLDAARTGTRVGQQAKSQLTQVDMRLSRLRVQLHQVDTEIRNILEEGIRRAQRMELVERYHRTA